MEKKVVFRKPKWLRRFASSFLDLLFAAILAVLFSFGTTPLSNLMFKANEARATYNAMLVDSGLYAFNDKNEAVLYNDIKGFDEHLTTFYQLINKEDEYNNLKKENSDLFIYDGTSSKYVEKEYDYNNEEIRVKYTNFYNKTRDKVLKENGDSYFYSLGGFKEAVDAITRAKYMSLLLASLIAFLAIYLAIPLIHKENKSLGKIIFKLKVVTYSTLDTKPSKLQILFRQLVLIMFEYVLSISTIGLFGFPIPIILIVSIVMVFVTKYNQSFHDMVTSTFLVDDSGEQGFIDQKDRYEVIFKDIKESKGYAK